MVCRPLPPLLLFVVKDSTVVVLTLPIIHPIVPALMCLHVLKCRALKGSNHHSINMAKGNHVGSTFNVQDPQL